MSPPTIPSTLFPYTTLFRSGSHRNIIKTRRIFQFRHTPRKDNFQKHFVRSYTTFKTNQLKSFSAKESIPDLNVVYDRSEEHTSELQSLRHLVCRLLLEKKNK